MNSTLKASFLIPKIYQKSFVLEIVSHSDAMDRRAWRATVHVVAKLQPMGSDTTELLTLE